MQNKEAQWWYRILIIVFVMAGASTSQAVELDSLPEMGVDIIAPMPEAYKEPRFFYGHVGAAMFNTGRYIGNSSGCGSTTH